MVNEFMDKAKSRAALKTKLDAAIKELDGVEAT